ncbi:putative gustatory receptor 57a [Drosophila novamexicana]|uniref:putative gustatory receptor 57a n=1 Tax=Drosophila novamexicana TaxID=47314 RepID=UPI0011E59606|nr:putative gustatory receptor 57a [Drosophila novamexicana]
MAIFYCFPEPETLYECVSLISRLQFALCCSGFFERGGRFVMNKWTRLYSLSCACLAVLGLAGTVHILMQNQLLRQRVLRLDKLVLSIMCLELVISTLVFLFTMLSLQAWAQRNLRIYQRLAELDKQLIGHFGARLNYRKLLRKHMLVLSMVAVLYFGAVNTGLASLAKGRQLGIVVPAALCYLIITSGPHLTGFVHMSLAELLGIRFRLLQQLLQPQLLHRRFGGQPQLLERRVCSLVDMVKELHYLIQEINRVYSLSLWSAMAHDFTLSTSELYIIFGRSNDNNNNNNSNEPGDDMSLMLLGFLSICLLVPFYKMLIGPVYCSHSVDEGRKCLHLLEQLDDWFPESVAIRQLVESIMRWRVQFKIEFTSGTGTVLNKTVITLYTSIVFNYLLVLISFAMIQKLGEQVEQQKVALQDWIGI